MQSAATVLGVLRERGRRGLPLEELYRQLFNPQLYLLAYGRIYANQGAMTPGVTQETVDGMSQAKIGRIIDAMRHERYRFDPVRRVHIPKKNGTTRPLGLPTWSDKLVGEVVRLLLEAYYEPTFSDRSHGFRPRRGCHTALREIANTWTGTSWFIEGDIADCFGSLDHDLMIGILSEKIHDNRFLRLVRNMLTAGYLEDWKWGATLSGAPQGGVASPILSSIYLHKLDQFVETVLIPEYTRGDRRARNPAYLKLQTQLATARRRGDRPLARTLRRRMVSLPSADPDDPGYRRLRYCRYADDHLLGFTGPKTEAEEIKQRLAEFLRDELTLELSQDKTLITHARTGAARFLGYEITVQHNDTKKTGRYRRVNGQVALRVPRDVIKAKSAPYLHRGKPAKQKALTNGSDHTIVATYGPSTGASSSTTCRPETSIGFTGCAGSWRPPCSRPWRASIARRCRRWRPSTKPRSRHRTGCAPASRHASNASAGSHWSHGSVKHHSTGRRWRRSSTACQSGLTIRTKSS
jgi:group II intron reverse transcriptase/maturase